MNVLRKFAVVAPAVALVVLLVASFLTRGAMSDLAYLHSMSNGLVDQRPWLTVQQLAPLAVTVEEKRFAQTAERLADHEVDQAFAMALSQASMAHRTLTGNALALQKKVTALQAAVKQDQANVDSLTASLKGKDGVVSQSDDLDLAKAQLQLDSDEISDATEDLARVSGDKRVIIQQELATHEAGMKKYDEGTDGIAQTAIVSANSRRTLSRRLSSWFDQRSRLVQIRQAQAEANADVLSLTTQHAQLEQQSAAATNAVNTAALAASGNLTLQDRVAKMAQIHALAKIHSILDDRIETQKQLADVYGQWGLQVELQHRIVSHLILQSLVWIAFLFLFAALVIHGMRSMLQRSVTDRRKLRTLEIIVTVGIEVVTLLLLLLIIFGPPNQIPTILGLATAGITLVFQNFILAFFGWFVLMGKHGFRIGDWVEINGVGGEVIEIGVFRTTMLETGNWTAKGHPTGRRVTFINNFAITGTYFNFSTSGQWMWDEIKLNIPQGDESQKTIEAIHSAVVHETEKDTKLAEQEWKLETKQERHGNFSAAPSIDLRPASSGTDIIVRYVTRAGDRFELRNKLYQIMVDLLHKS